MTQRSGAVRSPGFSYHATRNRQARIGPERPAAFEFCNTAGTSPPAGLALNPRQRDLFLWQWSRRRAPGRTRILLRGALVGAVGGAVFAIVLGWGMGSGANQSVAAVLERFIQAAALWVVSVPVFALIGWQFARRIYVSHEAQFQSLLQSGAQVPEQEPRLEWADRGPAVVVGVFLLLLVCAVLGLLIAFW